MKNELWGIQSHYHCHPTKNIECDITILARLIICLSALNILCFSISIHIFEEHMTIKNEAAISF